MYHDLYIGDDRPQSSDQFDDNIPTGRMLAMVVESLAEEKHGDELVIVVRTHRNRRK
jgi:hypothetical protein